MRTALLTLSIAAVTAGCGATEVDSTNTATGGQTGGTSIGGTGGGGDTGGNTMSGGTGGANAGSGGVAGGAQAGASTGGNSETGGAGGTAQPVVGTLSQPCSPVGALACAGVGQKLTVLCGGDGTWQASDTCPGTQLCYSGPGALAGSCLDPSPECQGLEPGALACKEGNAHICSSEGILSLHDECSGACVAGRCSIAAPCPEESFGYVNCADDCGGRQEACIPEGYTCPRLFAQLTPPVLRIPAAPELCHCESGTSYFEFYSQTETTTTTRLRMTVEKPWHILSGEGTDACTQQGSQCVIVAPVALTYETYWAAVVATDDAFAGPTNMIIEEVEEGAQCP